jgi:pyridoxine/pyridoxamine 5'-phosphate oxidase
MPNVMKDSSRDGRSPNLVPNSLNFWLHPTVRIHSRLVIRVVDLKMQKA